ITGFPSPITAGVAGNFTVTAVDGFGKTVTGYIGTVHFTTSDARGVLPGDYTFTAADQGVHRFSTTLITASAQSITASDPAFPGTTGSAAGITVSPAAASKLLLSAPSSVKA